MLRHEIRDAGLVFVLTYFAVRVNSLAIYLSRNLGEINLGQPQFEEAS